MRSLEELELELVRSPCYSELMMGFGKGCINDTALMSYFPVAWAEKEGWFARVLAATWLGDHVFNP